MNFGEAVEMMKQGKDVTSPRFQQNPEDRVVCLRYFPGTPKHEPFIAWILDDGSWEPMSYSHKNVLADDWEVIEDN